MTIAAAQAVPARGLRVDLRWFILALVFMALFAGFQGGRYYMANRLQELGIASALVLYALGAWRGLFQLPFAEWRRWVLGPALLIGGIMFTSALVFRLNYGGNLLFSVFSAREFLLGFIGPGLYLLCRCGLPLEQVKRVVWLALAALMFNYLLFYFTLDLRSLFFSSDHTQSNLVTYDAWRGFRLKPPLFAIMVCLMASLLLLKQARGPLTRTAALLLVAVAVYIWSIVQFRSTLATMLLAVLLYPLLLSHRNRVQVAVTAAPLVLLLAPAVVATALQHFLQADGGELRARAFEHALDHIARHPLLGAGEDSAYGRSYQDIVARYFYPEDIGLVGTAYKYGLLGATLYLFMHGKIWLGLWRANLAEKARHGRADPLLWAMLMFMTAMAFNLILNPALAYAQGITLGSLALALSAFALTPSSTISKCIAS